MAGGPVVSLISREIVVPAKPTERQSYFLSCFDLAWKGSNLYNQRVIFYESCTEGVLSGQDGGCDGRAAMEKLKSSLALCLVHYYPCCGRLSGGDRLFIDCNDAGVEFVEASLDLPISHLSRQAFQMKPLFQQLYQKLEDSGDRLYSSPLLSIQATLFSDGGLALGITQSHVLSDGHSLWNFMVSWGECARGIPLSLPPLLDRKMLALPNLSLETELNQDNQNKDALFGKKGESMGTDYSSKATQIHPSASVGAGPSTEADSEETQGEAPQRIPCVVNLPSSAIKKLKIEDGGVHTSYEVTSAHLWQRLAAARRRPSHEPTYFLVIANCRSRVNPPLPPAFFGNAIVFELIVSTSGEICSESLHTTASRIHDTIAEITQDSFVKNFMHWSESRENDVWSAIVSKIPKEGKGVNVGASPWFPVYEVDFGWGKPMAVRSPKVLEDGEMVFSGGHPKSIPGDVEICMGLPSYVLRRLLEDPSFLGKPPYSPFED